METPGLRELAEELAAATTSRCSSGTAPTCGSSSVCFDGTSESAMQADVLAGLLRQLGMAPAVIAGGSGGSRISLLTGIRHRDVAKGVAMWWISGGVFGLMTVGTHYCAESIRVAWNGGMEAVVELPEWQEVLERQPVEPPEVPRPRTARLHRPDGAVDGRLLPVRRRARARRSGRAMHERSTCPHWCSAAA